MFENSAGLSLLIGASADGRSVALGNIGWTEAAIFDLATGARTALRLISSQDTGPIDDTRGIAAKWSDVPGGAKVVFNDPNWPSHFVALAAAEGETEEVAAYSAANDWLAVADDKSLSIRPGSRTVPAVKSPTTGKITRLQFSPGGETLVIVTEADGIWSLRPASGEAHLLVRSDQLAGVVAGLDVSDTLLVVTAGSVATRVALNGGAIETLNGIGEPSIAITPTGHLDRPRGNRRLVVALNAGAS